MQISGGNYTIANMSRGGISGYKSQLAWNYSWDYWIIVFSDSSLSTNLAYIAKANKQLLISPNPTTGELKINYSDPRAMGIDINRIEIFNALGNRLLYETTNCSSCIVQCESFPPGIYFVKATAGEKTAFGKFIKE